MLSTWLLIFLFIVTAVVFLAATALRRQPRRRRKNPPPRPFLTVPYFGSVGLLTQRSTEYRHKALFDLSNKLGSGIFRTQIGRVESYIVTSYALFREATIEKPMEFITRPTQIIKLLQTNPNRLGIGDGDGSAAFMAYRKFVLVKLRSLGFGQRSMEDCILNECQALVDEINFSNKTKNEDEINLRDLLSATTANVIFIVLFSRHFRYDDKELLNVTRVATEYIKQSSLAGMTVMGFPWLEWVTTYVDSTREAHKALSGFIDKIIHERLMAQQKQQQLREEGEVQDFLDICLVERRKDPKLFSADMLSHTFEDLFLGGFETTATTLQWLILIMLHYPDLQEQLHQEIDERSSSTKSTAIAGDRQMITLDDTDYLPLTTATIWEVWRMYPLAPLGVPHATTSDTATLGGYDIEPEQPILFHLWSIHHDPKLWTEPEKFMPQRFLVRGDDDRMVFKNPEQVVVFSAGRRSCIGEQLARKEAFLLFANLLKNFSIKPKGAFPELRERPGFVMYLPDFQVDFVPRS